ncbi:flagellar biosynthesis protein FlgM [Bacteriovorax sp. DB6_IX]|uniref:flagellar biosynthesis protein FlgM n=1 Tax=Bacteriovorax sp. DB6_IX TaxID=1353530 RepID=UPI00038A21CD|nr:flagellar biosynthesis protein FlgM [Bacteriovorax sp. DB6_IX]EQC52567.1 anti-sigma-28 factor, FlgM domain protein [Bacteriovorax sp. DB6_IX]
MIKSYEFSDQQMNKVMLRTLEEYFMIDYCWDDLEKAFEDNKITEEGMKVISFINEDLKSTSKSLVQEIENKLKSQSIIDYEKVQELKNHLDGINEHYHEAD